LLDSGEGKRERYRMDGGGGKGKMLGNAEIRKATKRKKGSGV
jgi:hypothetical protein